MAKNNYIEEYAIGVGFDLPKFTDLQGFFKDVNKQIKENQESIRKLKQKTDSQYNSMALKQEKRHVEELSDVSKKWLAEEEARRRDIQQRWDDRKRKRVRQEKEFAKMQDAHSKNVLHDVKSQLKAEKAIEAARIKQHVQQMTQRDETFDRMRDYYQKENAAIREQMKIGKKQAAEEKERHRDTQKRWDARKNKRLKALRAEAKAVETVQRQIERQVSAMERSNAYKLMKASGGGAVLDQKMSALTQNTGNAKQMQQQLEGLKDLNAEMRRFATENRRAMRAQIGLTTVQNGLHDSTRNLIRSYASLFALLEAASAIKNVGMDFEAMRAGMLVAADDAQDVGTKLAWVDEQATRLGMNLTQTSKSFVKIAAASKGKIGEDDLQNIFLGIAEAGTVMQLSMDDMTGSLRAILQMIQKNQIMSEEFKGQLAERLPLAMKAMENATGKTSKELFKMMEMGQLGIDVLPAFGKELRKLANNGGALEKALETVRVTEAQFVTQSQKAADKIFQSGFGEGLSHLYKTLTDILKNAGPQLEKLGKIFEMLFRGIAHVARVVEGPLKFMIDNLEFMTGAYMIRKIAMMGAAFRTAFLPLTAALFAAEELAAFMSDDLVGVTEASMGSQFNLRTGSFSSLDKKNGEFFKGGSFKAGKGGMSAEEYDNLGWVDKFTAMKRQQAHAAYIAAGMMIDTAKGFVFGNDKPKSGNSSPTTVIENVTIQAPNENVAYATWEKIVSGSDVRGY